MPLKPGKNNIGNNITTEEGAGKPFNQAKAITLNKAYGPPKKMKPSRPKPMRKPTGRG